MRRFTSSIRECSALREKKKYRLFLHAVSKGTSFSPVGATPSQPLPKSQPLQVPSHIPERIVQRSQKKGVLEKKLAWGGVGWRGRKKRKRGHAKQRGKPQKQLQLSPAMALIRKLERAVLVSSGEEPLD